MGAAASTQAEHDELRAVFERFKAAPGNGDGLDAAAFAQLVREMEASFLNDDGRDHE